MCDEPMKFDELYVNFTKGDRIWLTDAESFKFTDEEGVIRTISFREIKRSFSAHKCCCMQEPQKPEHIETSRISTYGDLRTRVWLNGKEQGNLTDIQFSSQGKGAPRLTLTFVPLPEKER